MKLYIKITIGLYLITLASNTEGQSILGYTDDPDKSIKTVIIEFDQSLSISISANKFKHLYSIDSLSGMFSTIQSNLTNLSAFKDLNGHKVAGTLKENQERHDQKKAVSTFWSVKNLKISTVDEEVVSNRRPYFGSCYAHFTTKSTPHNIWVSMQFKDVKSLERIMDSVQIDSLLVSALLQLEKNKKIKSAIFLYNTDDRTFFLTQIKEGHRINLHLVPFFISPGITVLSDNILPSSELGLILSPFESRDIWFGVKFNSIIVPGTNSLLDGSRTFWGGTLITGNFYDRSKSVWGISYLYSKKENSGRSNMLKPDSYQMSIDYYHEKFKISFFNLYSKHGSQTNDRTMNRSGVSVNYLF